MSISYIYAIKNRYIKNTDNNSDNENDNWNDSQELLLAKWCERASIYNWLHTRSSRYYHKFDCNFLEELYL